MNDKLDTDCRCVKQVSTYILNIDTLTKIRLKNKELDKALEEHELLLVKENKRELAIDNTIEDPISDGQYRKNNKTKSITHNYEKEHYRQDLTVKLKNAIMVVWLDVK